MRRWRDHGYDEAAARAKTHENDLPNARRILRAALPADMQVGG